MFRGRPTGSDVTGGAFRRHGPVSLIDTDGKRLAHRNIRRLAIGPADSASLRSPEWAGVDMQSGCGASAPVGRLLVVVDDLGDDEVEPLLGKGGIEVGGEGATADDALVAAAAAVALGALG